MCAIMGSIFCMVSSTIYHTYYIIGPKYYEFLLKIDLMGIGIMIFTLSMCLTYTGFHNYQKVGFYLVLSMCTLMILNLVLQMTPCYMHDDYDNHRTGFYVLILILLLALALSWGFIFSTSTEFSSFFWDIIISFLYLGIGFFFFHTKYPQKYFRNYFV